MRQIMSISENSMEKIFDTDPIAKVEDLRGEQEIRSQEHKTKDQIKRIRVQLDPLPLRRKGRGPQKQEKQPLEIKRYKVMYSPYNTKKNKVWKYDGILQVQGQSLTLYKRNSKWIETRTPLFTSFSIEKIKPDLEFYLGRIEVKIMCELSAKDPFE